MQHLRRILLVLISLVFLGGGTALMIGMIRTRPAAPTVSESVQRLPLVEVAEIAPRSAAVPVVAHGTVRPKNQVQIIPQVPGRLVTVHPDLAPGSVLEAGELLFAVDATLHEARVRLARAEIAAFEAALRRHDDEAAVLAERLANAEKMLAIDEADYQSSVKLFQEDRVGTQRELDLVHQKYLRGKDLVVEMKSALGRIPNLKIETQAQLDAAAARLQQAKYDLEHTRILCPFRARVEAVTAFTSQVVSGMAPIAVLTDVSAYEIPVSLSPADLRWLHPSIRPAALVSRNVPQEIDVRVIWTLDGRDLAWKGRVSRFERIDELTRTVRLIVEVRPQDRVNSAEPALAAFDPGLSVGMYCRVELPSEPLTESYWVPRQALQEERWVYVVDDQGSHDGAGRLARREVTPLRVIGDEVLVHHGGLGTLEPTGLRSGDRLVVSPLTKPVEGMRVRAVPSQAAHAVVGN